MHIQKQTPFVRSQLLHGGNGQCIKTDAAPSQVASLNRMRARLIACQYEAARVYTITAAVSPTSMHFNKIARRAQSQRIGTPHSARILKDTRTCTRRSERHRGNRRGVRPRPAARSSVHAHKEMRQGSFEMKNLHQKNKYYLRTTRTMSSYQFVNSLASCYASAQAQAQAQQQQQQQQQGVPRATANSPGEPLQAASPTSTDYYNPNPAAAGYPTPCYSPQQHYPQHPYATPASAGMQHTAPTGMIDYTQLQPQPRLTSTATSQQQQQHAAAMHQQSQQHHQHLQQQQQQQLHADPTSPLLQAAAVAAAAASGCKYSVDTPSSTNVSSPQDLSTSNARNSPAPGLGAPGTSKAGASGQMSAAVGGSSRSSVAASASSPPSGSGRSAEAGSTLTTASSASSPASSTSSTSSTGNNSSNQGKGSGTQTQIYPWMKRVHIGQSTDGGGQASGQAGRSARDPPAPAAAAGFLLLYCAHLLLILFSRQIRAAAHPIHASFLRIPKAKFFERAATTRRAASLCVYSYRSDRKIARNVQTATLELLRSLWRHICRGIRRCAHDATNGSDCGLVLRKAASVSRHFFKM
ncbi:unnamed protein product [Trichogramma brassicae]|uniref:Homeobox domain-containing protein n=1 Tax=Trichogramma brassicae TaxID=86971 RepID=A0A6H5I5Z0_9HYME|nr:unnamed protein product [Trichogramma brassicae]